ncbi:MAG: helix-turn-helix domain-containing protein [Fimbriimonadaceae bacterium]
MRVQTRGAHHRSVMRVIGKVLQTESGPLRLPDLASLAGYSRTHLTRMFSHALGETPACLTRRLRLERAAYTLQTSPKSITDLAEESGFSGPEAFARAFRHAFGCAPSEFHRLQKCWKLGDTSALHWVPSVSDVMIQVRESDLGYQAVVSRRKGVRIAAYRVIGPYKEMEQPFQLLSDLLGGPPDQLEKREIFCIYHDNHRWVPHHKLRSDIGFTLLPGEKCPDGLIERAVPAGPYVHTLEFIPASKSGEVWRELNVEWIPRYGKRPRNIPAFDVLESWPLPGGKLTPGKKFIGLEVEMGEP